MSVLSQGETTTGFGFWSDFCFLLYQLYRAIGARHFRPCRWVNVALLTLLCWVSVLGVTPAEHTTASPRQFSSEFAHELMPGILAHDLNNPAWPRTQHDSLATGFSPLICNMPESPVVWASIKQGGILNSIVEVVGPDDKVCLLVNDGQSSLLGSDGEVHWTRSSVGHLIGSGDLRQDGGQYVLSASGPNLFLIDLANGDEIWRHKFSAPPHISLRGKIANILPDLPGLEAAIFFHHGEEACLINFPPEGEPQIVWKRKVVLKDEWDERCDHNNSMIELDVSQPDQPIIWNLRHHRCRGINARTGEIISTLTYDIAGQWRRNYGPMFLSKSAGGEMLACVFGEQVQTHVHCIRLEREGENELLWQHYYGEVYKEAPGVTVESHGLIDIDGNGAEEMAYSVRDPAENYRSFVRIRETTSGEIKFELPDHWGIGTFTNVGPDRLDGFLVIAAPEGTIPIRGEMVVYCTGLSSAPVEVGRVPIGGTWGPLVVEADNNNELLFYEVDDKGQGSLARISIVSEALQRISQTTAIELLQEPILAILSDSDTGKKTYVASVDGSLRGISWDGEELWRLPLEGGTNSALSAADLHGDGKAELIVATPNKRLQIFSLNSIGAVEEQDSWEHVVGWHSHHPVAYDLLGEGRLCLLTAGTDTLGRVVIRAHRPGESPIWESHLPAVAGHLRGLIFNAGQFLAKDHAGIAVSIIDDRRIHEGTYMLDGKTGEILWFKDSYRDGPINMPFRTNGIPTSFDFNGDGAQEVGMELLSYMAFVKGETGELVYARHTSNIRTDDALYAGKLYNTFCPIFATTNASPHWMVTAGFGTLGFMKPDPREGIWRVELGYDAPRNLGMIDVDGNGRLDVGYIAVNDTIFVCRDAWTGEVKWKVELPSAPNSTVITADITGDGKGEFFCGSYCIGTNADGEGVVLWQAPVHLDWPIIADFDGDGQGEIAGSSSGKIVVLKYQSR